MIKDRSKLTTEKRNSRSRHIDRCDALGIVDIMNAEDALIVPAVRKERRHIAAVIELVVEAFRKGGRLFYVGAGTSGRLGVLDASECPPTFGVKRTLVQGIIAGGRRALVRSIEGAEDDAAEGAKTIDRRKICRRDIVVGIAASGVTPFVAGAIRRAKQHGARTAFITCSPEAKKFIDAEIIINPVVGPEVITGSTRMKAGTATKLVLNTLTTAAMVLAGKVYGNLMVDLRATNAKLRDRAERIVMEATGLGRQATAKLLHRAGGHAKSAILMHLAGVDLPAARSRLKAAGQSLHTAISQDKRRRA